MHSNIKRLLTSENLFIYLCISAHTDNLPYLPTMSRTPFVHITYHISNPNFPRDVGAAVGFLYISNHRPTLNHHNPAGVTTMLNFFTTSNGFRSTLPVVSNLTAMNVWDGVCMCFIYASLLEFVCVNYVGRKRPLHNVVYRPGENPVTQVSALLPSLAFFCGVRKTF